MKKNVLNLFILLVTVFAVSSCSKDDDVTEADVYQVTEADVNGVYLGMMDVDAPWGDDNVQLGADSITQKIYITKTGENLVKLELKDFVFNGINVGSIEVNDIAVTKVGEGFEFEGNGKLTLIVGGCDVKVTGSLAASGMCHIIIAVDVTSKGNGMDFVGLKVTVDFTGNKLAADKSSEALIKSFRINSSDVVVTVSGNNVFLYVTDSAAALTYSPTIEVSAGATVTPASGVAQDFSAPVRYTVVSEDGITKTVYTVTKKGKLTVYDMQTWVEDKGNKKPTPEGLTNSNMAGLFLPIYGINLGGHLPVEKGADNAAEIRTFHSVSPTVPNTLLPGITAGTLFNGAFVLNMDTTLRSTHFGEPFRGKPVTFKMTYKYTPGSIFHKTVVKDSLDDEGEKVEYHTTEVVPGEKDACSICAYLYEVSDYEETLDGVNINKSEKVLLKAVLYDGGKADYTSEEVLFAETGNGTYDPAKKYKLAIVCSSSKRGDEFMGAPGSILCVKRLEIASE